MLAAIADPDGFVDAEAAAGADGARRRAARPLARRPAALAEVLPRVPEGTRSCPGSARR